MALTGKRSLATGVAWAAVHCAAGIGIGGVVSAPAFAQDAGSPTSALPEESAQNAAPGLGEIIVEARRRKETMQDVPVAMTALTGAQLEQRALTDMDALTSAAPEFVVSRGGFGAGGQLTLRGVSTTSTVIGIEQSVATIVDGVYFGNARIMNEGLFDMERVEILKGPQALFFGKNATAGVVNIATAGPTTDLYMKAKAGFEFRSQQAFGELVVSAPLSDTLGVRVALRGSKMFGGYYDNTAPATTYTTTDIATGIATSHVTPRGPRDMPGGREIMGRVTLRWQPTDRLTATLKGSATSSHTNSPGWSLRCTKSQTGISSLDPTDTCRGKFEVRQNNIPLDIAASLPHNVVNDEGDLLGNWKSWSVTGTLEYDLDNITLTSISNYHKTRNKWASDANWQGGPRGFYSVEDHQFSAFSSELRALTSFEGPVNLMLGAYYQNTDQELNQAAAQNGLENSNAPRPEYRYVGNVKFGLMKGETISGYGQLLWQVVPAVELSGGVRYTHETKDSFFVQPYSHPAGIAAGTWLPNSPLTPKQTFNAWSPEVTLKYAITPDVMVFGAYKTAYKSGGFNIQVTQGPNTNETNTLFKPEKGRGFEMGVKSTLLDKQLRFNLTAYRYKYTDLQIENFDAQKIALVATNAGSTIVKGVEADLQFAPRAVPGLVLSGTVNYNRARYQEFIGPCWVGQKRSQGCTLTSIFGLSQNLAGKPTAMAPDWTAAAGVEYETQVSDGWWAGASVNGRYSSSYFTNAFARPFSRQSGYAVLDGSITVRSDDNRWTIALIGKNLTNRFYQTGGLEGLQTGSGTATEAGIPSDQIGFGSLPRTVQLSLTWAY